MRFYIVDAFSATPFGGNTAGVVLLGSDGAERITAEDIARWSGTISYEVLLSRSGRVRIETVEDRG